MLVSKKSLFGGCVLFVLAAINGCGGGGGGGGGTGLNLSRVKVDSGRSAKATIGPAGGTITATASNGAVYTFTVPAKALTHSTDITMYPVTSIDGLPFDKGLIAGAHFTPEGLQLSLPATLSVVMPGPIDPSTAYGFSYSGDRVNLSLYPLQVAGSTLTLQFTHFSGGGAGRGPSHATRPTDPMGAALYDIALVMQNSANRTQAEIQSDIALILESWYSQAVKPELVRAATATNPGFVQYSAWVKLIYYGPFPSAMRLAISQALADLTSEGRDLAAKAIDHLISSANSACTQNNDLASAKRVLSWRDTAHNILLEDAFPEKYSLDAVLANICVKVDISINPAFPTSLDAGQSGTLTAKAGYKIGTNAVKYDQEMAWTVHPTFATDNTQTGGLVNNGKPATFGGTWTRATVNNALLLTLVARFSDSDLADIFTLQQISAGGGTGQTQWNSPWGGDGQFGGDDFSGSAGVVVNLSNNNNGTWQLNVYSSPGFSFGGSGVNYGGPWPGSGSTITLPITPASFLVGGTFAATLNPDGSISGSATYTLEYSAGNLRHETVTFSNLRHGQ